MNAVIDAGPSNTVGRRIWGFIRDTMNVRHLDYTFISHYHSDHIDGMDKIIDSVNVYPDSFRVGAYDRGDTFSSVNFTDYIIAAGPKRNTAYIGQVFNLGSGVSAQCVCLNGKTLSGDSIIQNSEENNNSLGLLITFGNFKIVFATDIAGYNSGSYKDIESILAPDIGQMSVMIVNHHGSATSSNPLWVSTLNPKASIISMGSGNSYGHPTQDAIDRLFAYSSTYIYQSETSPAVAGIIPAGRGRVMNSNIWIVVGDTSFTVAGDHYSLQPQGVELADNELKHKRILAKAYPNPFTNEITFDYFLDKSENVSLNQLFL